jgi:hypothetical protein
MVTTNFQDYNENTPIVAAWLNDVNATTYSPGGVPKLAVQSAAAWVVFSVVGGAVTIKQSSNIQSVVRASAGVYVITYGEALTNANNCYGITANTPGFSSYSAEATTGVTISLENTSGTPTDPGEVSFVVFGAN